MAHNEALMELESLREQYGYINEKLNKQSLINEKMMSETIRTKINRTEQWYRQRFLIYALCPVGVVGFVNRDSIGDLLHCSSPYASHSSCWTTNVTRHSILKNLLHFR